MQGIYIKEAYNLKQQEDEIVENWTFDWQIHYSNVADP